MTLEELREWLERQRFDPDQGDEAERAYRRTWNHAIDHVRRELAAPRKEHDAPPSGSGEDL